MQYFVMERGAKVATTLMTSCMLEIDVVTNLNRTTYADRHDALFM